MANFNKPPSKRICFVSILVTIIPLVPSFLYTRLLYPSLLLPTLPTSSPTNFTHISSSLLPSTYITSIICIHCFLTKILLYFPAFYSHILPLFSILYPVCYSKYANIATFSRSAISFDHSYTRHLTSVALSFSDCAESAFARNKRIVILTTHAVIRCRQPSATFVAEKASLVLRLPCCYHAMRIFRSQIRLIHHHLSTW